MEQIKTQVNIPEPIAKKKEECIQRLQKDARIAELLQRNHIPASELSKNPFMFSHWLEEIQPCVGCKGLGQCKQKSKGYYYDLRWDGMLQNVFTPCRYQKDHQKQIQHLRAFLVNDMGKQLETVSFDQMELSKETPSYLAVLKKVMQLFNQQSGVYLYGNMGTGKTYLAACAANAMAKEGKSVAFVHMPSFSQRMKDHMKQGEYKVESDRMAYCDFLVLDDIGAESVSAWIRDDILFSILNTRMENHRLTWFTSNEDLSSLENHYAYTSNGIQEKVKAERLLERIRFLSKPVELLGNDRRNPF